jgi:hypothetical protein
MPHRAVARATVPACHAERRRCRTDAARSHGGKSTGPTTAAGRERLRAARTVHGCHSAEGREFRAAVADLLARGRRLRLIRAMRQHATG